MNPSRKTKRIYNDRAIYTVFEGDLDADFIIETFEEWCDLLNDFPSIQFLVANYTHSNMDSLSTNDLEDIAFLSGKLIEKNAVLNRIGIVPSESDLEKTNIWTGFSMEGMGFEFQKIIITKTYEEAMEILKARLVD